MAMNQGHMCRLRDWLSTHGQTTTTARDSFEQLNMLGIAAHCNAYAFHVSLCDFWTTQCCCVCRHGSPSPYQKLEPLLKALQVPCLSRAVQQSVVPVAGWSGSVELDPIIADCLLALQRYLVHHMPALYQAEQDTVAPLLLNLR